jgi:hypothetical protein
MQLCSVLLAAHRAYITVSHDPRLPAHAQLKYLNFPVDNREQPQHVKKRSGQGAHRLIQALISLIRDQTAADCWRDSAADLPSQKATGRWLL